MSLKNNWTICTIFFSLLLTLSSCTPVKEFKGNLHTHTSDSFDGYMTYEEAIAEAQRLEFDFIAITDHNRLNAETANKCSEEKKLLCIMGEELTKEEDHILGIDLESEIRT